MASEARELLDEQIASLNALRGAAQWAYQGTAALPAMARFGNPEVVASHLARLVVEGHAKLNDSLECAEHWLGPTDPVYVPVPAAEGDYPSACGGASYLLQQLAVLAGIEAGTSDPLPTDSHQLEQDLVAKFPQGIPDWLLSAPVNELQELVETVRRETDAAIARLSNQFGKGQPAEPVNESPTPKKPKRSTQRDEAREKLISALTFHHKFSDGSCLNQEPIGCNKLARVAEVASSSANRFFNKTFDGLKGKEGYSKYKIACRTDRLLGYLKGLNGDFSEDSQYGRRPPDEDDRDNE